MKIGNVNSNINFNGFGRFQNQDKTEKSDVINTALILGAQSRYGKTDAFKPNEYQANKVNFINIISFSAGIKY